MRQVIQHDATKPSTKIPSVALVRVSSKKFEQTESYNAQCDYWERKLGIDPFVDFKGIYGDEGISGRTQRKRPAFQQMMIDARLGKFKTIYTKSLSRFGRNNCETVSAILVLLDVGINVVFENENLDTKNLNSQMFIKIRSILAEKESDTMQ